MDPAAPYSPEAPLLVIETNANPQVLAEIPTAAARGLHTGLDVGVRISDAERQRKAALRRSCRSPTRPLIRVQFKVDLPPGAAVPNGQFIKVEIPMGSRNASLVPRQAVRETGQLTGVFVVDSASKARFRLVKTVPYRCGARRTALRRRAGGERSRPGFRRNDRWDDRGDEAMSKPQMAGRLAHAFIHSKLTPLILLASISLGVAAVFMLPREEEPQIIVPMIDVMVSFPGASAKEVETRIAKPMERLLWEIPGVEYIYTTSSPGSCMAIVRFYVGEDEEKSIVRLNQKMFSNFDLIPPGASQPLIKPRSIDDVPFLALTLWSNELDGYQIRRAAQNSGTSCSRSPTYRPRSSSEANGAPCSWSRTRRGWPLTASALRACRTLCRWKTARRMRE